MTFGMLHGALRASVVAATVATSAAALSQQTAPPPPPPAAAAAGQVAAPVAPAPKPHEEIVKLWKGNLSEEFIKRKIDSDGVVYHLSADDIIACKAANVPESIIEAMMKTATKQAPATGSVTPLAGAAAAVAPAAVGAPAALAAGAPPAVPVPNYAAMADRTWEGIALRNPGVVLFKSRWDAGRLTFKEEKLTWIDARDETKNRVLPAKAIKEQFLVCLKGSSVDPDCFEWGVRSEDAEYRIRDIGWERSEGRKPQELYDFLKALYPSLVSVKYPADKK